MTRNSQPQHLQHLISNVEDEFENAFIFDNIRNSIAMFCLCYVKIYQLSFHISFFILIQNVERNDTLSCIDFSNRNQF